MANTRYTIGAVARQLSLAKQMINNMTVTGIQLQLDW